MPRTARKHPLSSTALVQHGGNPALDADAISADEAVLLAVKVLQETSAIVPAALHDEDESESDDEGSETAAPAFIKKLKELIDDAEVDSISWTEDGNNFVIAEPKRLSEQLIKYFKSSKLKSFVRQLHFYGFKKVGGTRFDDWTYNHKFFQRDGRLLHKLRRKTCGPDQQIRNLQIKVNTLQGSLVDTQQKLGDMAVALMALLQHHQASRFLGDQQPPQQQRNEVATHQRHEVATQESIPAKRARPSPTSITCYEQSAGGGGAVILQARRLPVSGVYGEILSAHGNNGGAMALTPAADFDFGAEFDDLFAASGVEEFGLFSDVESRVSAVAGVHAAGLTA
jgi:hypothetical protein